MRIRSAQEDRDEAQAQAQARAGEAGEARRKVAELEGALSVSTNVQVQTDGDCQEPRRHAWQAERRCALLVCKIRSACKMRVPLVGTGSLEQ